MFEVWQLMGIMYSSKHASAAGANLHNKSENYIESSVLIVS